MRGRSEADVAGAGPRGLTTKPSGPVLHAKN